MLMSSESSQVMSVEWVWHDRPSVNDQFRPIWPLDVTEMSSNTPYLVLGILENVPHMSERPILSINQFSPNLLWSVVPLLGFLLASLNIHILGGLFGILSIALCWFIGEPLRNYWSPKNRFVMGEKRIGTQFQSFDRFFFSIDQDHFKIIYLQILCYKTKGPRIRDLG